jgi:arylamine N-acetyltransferase
MLARATTEARYLLLGNRLMTRPAKGSAEVRTFESPDVLGEALRTVFGLNVQPDWRSLLERFAPPEIETAR